MLYCVENIALQSLLIFYIIVLRAEIVTTFDSKMVAISTRNTKAYNIIIVIIFYFHCRSEDVSHICYQDTCAEEVFYPLLTSYDGESREVAIAYGLMLVAFVLFFTSVSTSLLQNLKTLVIG